MKKNIITNKITPCCSLPFSVIYWWVSNLILNSEADRSFILSIIGQSGTIAIDGWKVLINSGKLEADASLTKADFLAWFDCGNQPDCKQLKIIVESFKLGAWKPETELPLNVATIDGVFNGQILEGNTFTKEQITSMIGSDSIPIGNISQLLLFFRIVGNSVFRIVDNEGFIGLELDEEGILKIKDAEINGKRVADVLKSLFSSESNTFRILDDNRNIAFEISQNGEMSAKPSKLFIENVFKNNSAELVLPSKIPIVVGTRFDINYENALKGAYAKDYYIYIDRLKNGKDKFVFEPNNAGNETKKVTLENGNGVVLQEKNVSFIYVPKTAGSGANVKVLICGDSKTENNKKLCELVNIFSKDSYTTLTLLGTRVSSGLDADGNMRNVKGEGYSGRSVIDLTTQALVNGVTNIFYNSAISGTYKFDVSKAISILGQTPDIIFIDHGANQNFNTWETVKPAYEYIIQNVKAYNLANSKNIKVVFSIQEQCGLLPQLNRKSDGKSWFNYPSNLKKLIDDFDNRNDVFLCPQYLNVNYYDDFPVAEVPKAYGRNRELERICVDVIHMGINMNGYDSAKNYSKGEIFRIEGQEEAYIVLKDGVLNIPPTDDKVNYAKVISKSLSSGYYKNADSYYNTIKYLLTI